MRELRDKLGVCQWFHYEDFEAVERAVSLLRRLGVRHVRTGLSWADYHRPRGRAWYAWQMEQLAEFDVLLSIWHTPPSLAEGQECAGPPKRLKDYGEFVGLMIDDFGGYFSHLELWNEPNNRLKWAYQKDDPRWTKFGEMIRFAAWVAKSKNVPTVLGGMIPVDHHWLRLMESYGALDDIDIIAIHGFPEMWWNSWPNWDWHRDWRGWQEKVSYIARHTDKPIWITETGLATWDMQRQAVGRRDLQVTLLQQAAAAPVERVYWYSLIDLSPQRDAIEGFHVDENEYHFGLVTHDGRQKPAFGTLRKLLLSPSEEYARQSASVQPASNS